MPSSDSPDYAELDHAVEVYGLEEMVARARAVQGNVDVFDEAALIEAGASPRELARMRSINARMARVGDLLGWEITARLLQWAMDLHQSGKGRVADLLDEALTVIERA